MRVLNKVMDLIQVFDRSSHYTKDLLYDLALTMMVVMILEVIMICGFLCAVGEKCQRRVCHLDLYNTVIRDRFFHKKNFPLYCTQIILHRVQVTATQDIDLNARDGLIDYVDMVDLATYAFDLGNRIEVKRPKHHSPLYSKDTSSTKTIDFMARYVAGMGVKKEKIDIGLSFSISTYYGKTDSRTYYFALIGSYAQTCNIFSRDDQHYILEPDKGRFVEFHKVRDFYKIIRFYDTPETIKEKVKYVKANGYGGVLMYRIGDDDGLNDCDTGYNPLSKAVLEECRTWLPKLYAALTPNCSHELSRLYAALIPTALTGCQTKTLGFSEVNHRDFLIGRQLKTRRVKTKRVTFNNTRTLRMRLVGILAVIMICGLLCVFGETCQRRVCHLRLFPIWIRDRFFHKKNFPLYCTHIILHRVQVTATQEIDLNEIDGLLELHRVVKKKRQNPQLIVIVAVQNDKFDVFVKMYTTDEYRNKFIRNIIQYASEKTIDGVKIDIQHKEGGNKEKFTLLIKELMAAFTTEASTTKSPRLLLSVGIPSDKSFIDKYYDVLEISNYVDMVDLATYNFVTDNRNEVSRPNHHSPLYSKDKTSTKTIDYMARYVAGMGVRKEKMNIGLSFMVSTYYGKTDKRTYYFASIGEYAKTCDIFSRDDQHYILEPDKGRVVEFQKVRDFYTVRRFYDTPKTIKEKVKYVKANGYGGVLMYRIDDDDDIDDCNKGYNPLSKAVLEECSSN
ncbi:hypothetical protein Btru_066844 [Bulinus truncatus]|nr:hypothetical protein Btru_066844 [Bulinus truncatus]